MTDLIGRLPEPWSPSGSELARAARTLTVRSRREAAGALVGGYRSAFHGGGIEFEESRPYAPGDDVRTIDWNVVARTGETWVKRFREERDQTVLLAVDVSASMGFGTGAGSKAATAVHAAALIAAAARQAGDRTGLLLFANEIVDEIPPGRGGGHAWRLLRTLAAAPGEAKGATSLQRLLEHVRDRGPRRGVLFIVSDFRDDEFFESGPGVRPARATLVALARRLDIVGVSVDDPRERELPRGGSVWVADPERPDAPRLLRTRRGRARRRYATASAVRRRSLARRLRSDGIDLLELSADRSPLRALGRFFWMRNAERRSAAR